jgi:fatty-acyl-CoA synthase
MIISGGEILHRAEAEQIIVDLEAVGTVAVIGVSEHRGGEVPQTIIIIRSGTPS